MNRKKPEDIPLKNGYSHFELPDVLIHVSGDVKTLFYMLKEYESKKNDTRITNNDMLIMLAKCYMDKNDLDFWNPKHPQYKQIEGVVDDG
jgi:hypothetical protein